jgi:hypothetical protein
MKDPKKCTKGQYLRAARYSQCALHYVGTASVLEMQRRDCTAEFPLKYGAVVMNEYN